MQRHGCGQTGLLLCNGQASSLSLERPHPPHRSFRSMSDSRIAQIALQVPKRQSNSHGCVCQLIARLRLRCHPHWMQLLRWPEW